MFLANPTFWIAFGSVATAALAVLTYRSLSQYRRREQSVENRELIEKIVQPILEDIALLIPRPLQDFFVSQPRWLAIRRDNPVIIHRIPNKVATEIDTLFDDVEKIQLRADNNTRLIGIYTNRIIEKLNHPPATYDSNFGNHASYRWKIRNGKTFYFTFPSFIYSNSTLAEEIEKSKGGDTNAIIEGEIFSAGSGNWREVNQRVFDEILANIKADIAGSPDLAEYVQMFRGLQPEVESLVGELKKLKIKLSK